MNECSRRGATALLLSMGLLHGVQAGVVEVVDATKPSVLAVGTANALKNPRFSFRGTGFVVGDGNHLITNAHVLPSAADADPADRLAVVLPKPRDDRDVRAATLVASDLAFNVGPSSPSLTRVAFRLGGSYGCLAPTLLERLLVRDRARAGVRLGARRR